MRDQHQLRGTADIRGRSPYPERGDVKIGASDLAIMEVIGRITSRFENHAKWLAQRIDDVEAFSVHMQSASDHELRAIADSLRSPLLRQGFQPPLVARSFALIREVSSRQLGLRHYPVQIMGGWALLLGMLAEMNTGEGKTLTAVLPAATAALAGKPIHIITVNDYLAARDAEQLNPVYEALGLSVGVVQHGQDPAARRAAYGCDITYGVNKEIAFDYLRDRLARGARHSLANTMVDRLRGAQTGEPLLLRGLHFAIVDEADSILIDEARTPLIISGLGQSREPDIFITALSLARQMIPVDDFEIAPKGRSVRLTKLGSSKLKRMTDGFAGIWAARAGREELVCQALAARHLYRRNEHYVVVGGKVQIVDEFTGRIAEGRTWQHGLHQIIEVKEECEVTDIQQTRATITYQRFFRRYLHLAGMSGTASEVAAEVKAVYGLRVARIPPNRPIRRTKIGSTLFKTADQKWAAVIESARHQQALGRPVLIGTRSVEDSELLSRQLTQAAIEHVVLNAHHDREEADIIANAGQRGRITVATNMAGRGTDIQLGAGVAMDGGLHVILTEFHESSRIDRQLIGRGGRQGDPSTFEEVASLDDELFKVYAPTLVRIIRTSCPDDEPLVSRFWARILRRSAQRAAEQLHHRMRKDTLRFQANLDKALAFSSPE